MSSIQVSLTRGNRNQRGQTLVIVALALTVLVGIAGLAIEGGLLQADRRFDQDISDGAALAGSHKLSAAATATEAQAARIQAANYAVSGLNGGSVPSGCNTSGLAVDNVQTNLPAACDPSPTHSLLIQTPYNGHVDQILVRLNHGLALNLAAVVGAGSARTASRSVAKSFSGGNPFGYAVYAGGNMITNGNTSTNVKGNVYVRGCVQYNNADSLTVEPSWDATQKGTVEIYGDPNVPNVGSMPQVWDKGAAKGCTAKITGLAGPSQWGASGHAAGAENCAPVSQFNTGVCPSGEPPVPLIGFPLFGIQDTTGAGGQPCNQASAATFTTSGGTASAGCYSACGAGGNVKIPSGTIFSPGTYAFVGNGVNGCDVEFNGDAHNTTTLGDGSGGVTFILYNGTALCASKCGSSNGSGALTFNAPTSGHNAGILIYSCNGTCGNASGQIWIKGPSWTLQLTGTIYNPAGDCIIHSNSNQSVTGQVICYNITLQGGAVSLGSAVNWNAGTTGIPNFLAQLIE